VAKEWILNQAMNRWGLNKKNSVGPVSELIRKCTPKKLEDWESFYYEKIHRTFEDYKWKEMQETTHLKFQKKFSGRVFIVFSVKVGDKKKIKNVEIIDEIKKEIERVRKK
jgi:hypothetical protein